MHFPTILTTLTVALAGVASADNIRFADYTRQTPCGINGSTCAQPFCVISVKGVHGCTGDTEQIGGRCDWAFGASTTTLKLCGSAHLYLNGCHLKEKKPACIDFRNKSGDFGRWVSQGPTTQAGSWRWEDGRQCKDDGLGKCP